MVGKPLSRYCECARVPTVNVVLFAASDGLGLVTVSLKFACRPPRTVVRFNCDRIGGPTRASSRRPLNGRLPVPLSVKHQPTRADVPDSLALEQKSRRPLR